MSIPGLVLALLLSAAATAWIAAPLVRRSAGRATGDVALQKRRERLVVYYERVLANLRDLDEDRSLGKIEEAEYQAERELWVRRGIEALKAIDALEATLPQPVPADDETLDRDIDRAIEAAVAAYRQS